MKILWVSPNFLHPTTKGGQIRTLEMLRRLHQRHEVHYLALEHPDEPEGVARSGEYCTRAYPLRVHVPSKDSPRFLLQAASSLLSSLPLSVSRFTAPEMSRRIAELRRDEKFDRVVCDFLAPAANFPSLRNVILFEHNVETMIWRRRVEQARTPWERAYLRLEARRMFEFEKRCCREASAVIAVSESDAQLFRQMFELEKPVADVPTGVDLDYFAPTAPPPPRRFDLAFLGSMDWMPNVDGIEFFVQEALPLIRRAKPDCTLAIVGRQPPRQIKALAERDSNITVTGTVPDVRPYLWSSAVSIVPLRVGGGTRLKIYEAVAARIPVVSTTIGAEGLPLRDPEHIRRADTAEAFADCCVDLLDHEEKRRRMAESAWDVVASRFSWERVTQAFESILENAPGSQP
jgi:polysaccharide biosynthesis protein PslH